MTKPGKLSFLLINLENQMNYNKEGLDKTYDNFKDLLNLLLLYNYRLNEYVTSIRAKQKIGHGSVLLRLTHCGKSCTGCPHVHWDYWFEPEVPSAKSTSKFHPLELKGGPLRRTRGKRFPSAAKTLIKEALKIIEQRNVLVKNIGRLTKCFSNQRKSSFWIDHFGEDHPN